MNVCIDKHKQEHTTYNMEPWKLKVITKTSKGSNAGCKKHPKHIQSPGVCSMCLNEKLFQLSNSSDSSSSSRAGGSSSSSSSSSSSVSSLTSSEVSSCSSPVVNWEGGARVFKKSRSIAFVEKNKGGFWSKLLLPKSGQRKLMHSKTMQIDRVITAVH